MCGIFVFDISARSVFFCSFVCAFIFLYTNVTWYRGENDDIFRKSVHFISESCNERS